MSKHNKKRMAVYLDPDIKDWWEDRASEFGCAASTLASQLLTVIGKKRISPAEAMSLVASAGVPYQHVSAPLSTFKHSAPGADTARSDPLGGLDSPPQPSTLPPVQEEEEEEEESPPQDSLDPRDLINNALLAHTEHGTHDPKVCMHAADLYSENGNWESMFKAGVVSDAVIHQARQALAKAERCSEGKSRLDVARKLGMERVQAEHDHAAQVIAEALEEGKEPGAKVLEKLARCQERLGVS